MRGPAVSEYGFPTQPMEVTSTAHTDSHNAPTPTEHSHTTAHSLYDENSVPIPRPWQIVDVKECQDFLEKHGFANTRRGEWCAGGSDGHLCWPATAPGIVAAQPCPITNGDMAIAQNATRHCGADGKWNISRADGSIEESADPDFGWTNFEACRHQTTEAPIAVAGVGMHVLLKETMQSTEATVRSDSTDAQPEEETTTITTTEATEASATEPSKMALTAHAEEILPQPWLERTESGCLELLRKKGVLDGEGGGWCKGGTDGTICWQATKKGDTITLPCPNLPGLDSSKHVSRTCNGNGEWAKTSGSYVDCISPTLKDIIKHDYHLIHPNSAAHRLQLLPWMFVNFLVVILFL